MASKKRKGGATKNDLITAIRYLGGRASLHKTKKQLREIWGKIRKAHKEEGIELPKLQTVVKQAKAEQEYEYEATPRDENMNTLPPEEPLNLGYDYIQDFIKQLTNIYEDTKTWAEGWSDKSLTATDRQHRYMCYQSLDDLTSTYYEILNKLDQIIIEYGYDKVANAIAGDVELDYSIALSFMPPSSVKNEMTITLELINGIMSRLSIA